MLTYRVFVLDENGFARVATTIMASDEEAAMKKAHELCGPHAKVELWVGPVRVAEEECQPQS
jgi:hypothetical protein